MNGLMMNMPLTVNSIMRFAATNHPDSEIVSLGNGLNVHRYCYSECFSRAKALAKALSKLGVSMGDRIGTLAWNDYRHLELYYATSCSGLVCHTINPRLFENQIEYIINHAEDQWIFVDPSFMPIIEKISDKLDSLKGIVVLCGVEDGITTSLNNVYFYESLILAGAGEYEWPEFDELSASGLCYTSGTTGNPKGVLYHHRSTVLHSYANCLSDAHGTSAKDCVMPVVPMYHSNAWGVPFSAIMAGAKIVLPGSHMGDGESLQYLIETESVTKAFGVPTVWQALLQYLQKSDKSVDSLETIIVGGSALPDGIRKAYEDTYSVTFRASWGMTEISPMGTMNSPKREFKKLSKSELEHIRQSQGRAQFGVELKITDENNMELPRDGVAFGNLKVRGFWTCSEYFGKGQDSGCLDADGWLKTGDVASIDQHGYLYIHDRTKDVIKSGGEWISSITLENIAMDHPGVLEAAAISIPHPKWDERPLLVVVKDKSEEIDRDTLFSWYSGKVANWWIPDEVVFIDELPHTATGKINKLALRKKVLEIQEKTLAI